MIKQELREILCCPACKGDLDIKNDENSLKCKQCGRVYEVKEDIPIMVVSESTPFGEHDGR